MVHRSIFKTVTHVLLLCATVSVILCSARCCALSVSDRSCYTRDGASLLAEKFVKGDETFRFDGLKETLSIRVEHINSLDDIMGAISGTMTAMTLPVQPKSFTFKAKFDSRHSGYGDRTGKILAQVITPHEAEITIENCEVKSAVMDGRWDMLSEKPIA